MIWLIWTSFCWYSKLSANQSLNSRMHNLSLCGDLHVRACHDNLEFNWLCIRQPVLTCQYDWEQCSVCVSPVKSSRVSFGFGCCFFLVLLVTRFTVVDSLAIQTVLRFFYYLNTNVLLDSTPLVKFILNYIQDPRACIFVTVVCAKTFSERGER